MSEWVSHGSFTLERVYAAGRWRVYAAWADPQEKARWFAGPAGEWEEVERTSDFRIGGRERVVGRVASGSVTTFDATYHEIVPGSRIVFAYAMLLDGRRISVSLATVELASDGEGTRVRLTEQGAFLPGYEDGGGRQRGTALHLDRIGALVETPVDDGGTGIVRVTRRFAAAPERVFDAWLDRDNVGAWLFATPEGEMVSVEIDARVGGAFRIVERRGAADVPHVGQYLEIDRPRRLVFTFGDTAFDGEVSRVTIEIAPVDGGCELVLTHEGVLPRYLPQTRVGWTGILEGLSGVLGR